MTNEEKAIIIANLNEQLHDGPDDWSYDECFHSAMEMAEWKDKQFEKQKKELLEKACEWLTENINISKRPSHIVMDFHKYMEKMA